MLPRKYHSYRCFDRAGRAELCRTRWQTVPSCTTPTPTRIIKLSGRVLQWGWLGPRWGIPRPSRIRGTSSVLPLRFSTKPYLMCHDNKRAKNSHGFGNYSNTSDGSDRSNQGQGGNSHNQSNYGNHGIQGGGRGKQKGNQNPNTNQN